ncbi:MAG: hypothetical protein F6K10_02805 [Moorea sp. SIO2B7]|nr:hypothetical protein [Moorena sp. SIO2B7]
MRSLFKTKLQNHAIAGAKEVESNTLSIRTHTGGELAIIAIDEVISRMTDAIANHDNF